MTSMQNPANPELAQRNRERFGVAGAGYDLSNLDGVTEEEIQNHLKVWINYTRDRGVYYGLNALSFLADNRPDIAKLSVWANGGVPTGLIDEPSRWVMQNVRNIVEYIRLGWEEGIYNEFRELQMRGMTKAQIVEVVMFAQTNGGGIRGMGHVHNAVGKSLFDWQDGTGLVLPEGWAADPEAFKSGLDLSTSTLTPQDKTNLENWYESTIGWVPKSVSFGIRHNPRFFKVQRAKWEATFKILPKQFAPFLMLAQHTTSGLREGLREAAMLAKAWGFTHDWVMEPISGQAFWFHGSGALEFAADAIGDILDDWDR